MDNYKCKEYNKELFVLATNKNKSFYLFIN